MPLPACGPLSLNQIQTEFGGSNPISLSEYYAGGGLVPSGTSGTYGAVPSSGTISIRNFYGTAAIVTGQIAYTTPGTYTWVAPASGVTSVSVVAVGAGAAGCTLAAGGGGGLGYKNNYPVTGGTGYTVVVGGHGVRVPCTQRGRNGQDSYFISTGVVRGGGGGAGLSQCPPVYNRGPGGTYTGDGGGNGGDGRLNCSGYIYGCFTWFPGGGGGAGGYSGNGGTGGTFYQYVCCCTGIIYSNTINGANGAGGGGGGGGGSLPTNYFNQGIAGGGVGLLGQGANGAGGLSSTCATTCQRVGKGGSGGGNAGTSGIRGTCGGLYGGGGAGPSYGATSCSLCTYGKGGTGAVRIIYPGNTRSFPSTNTGNL